MRIEFYQSNWWEMKQVEREGIILDWPLNLRIGDCFKLRGPHKEGSPLLEIDGNTEFRVTDNVGFDSNVGEILIECEPV